MQQKVTKKTKKRILKNSTKSDKEKRNMNSFHIRSGEAWVESLSSGKRRSGVDQQ